MKTFMGKPCKFGHDGERYVNCRSCAHCSRERARKNPERNAEWKRAAYAFDPVYRERRKALSRKTYARVGNSDDYRAKRRKRNGLPDPTRPCPALCEICERRKARVLDHCHTSGSFRGWLCNDCNLAIGKFGDNIEGLMNAVRYLERAAEVKT